MRSRAFGVLSFDWRGWVVPVGLIIAVEIWARVVDLRSDSLAAPTQIAVSLFDALMDGTALHATAQTLTMASIGVALGCGIGLLMGVLLGLWPQVNRLAEFSVEALRPIPSTALIPVAMLAYGFGYTMEIAIIAFASCWPMLILARAAVGSVKPRLLEVSRMLGFGLFARIWKFILPATLPRIFIAFRLSVGIALIVAVTVEIAANPFGLGYAMTIAQQSLRPALMFAILLWIGLVGWFLNALLVRAQGVLFQGSPAIEESQP